MAYRECELGALVRVDPGAAGEHIMDVYRQNAGNTTKTATALGVDRRTLTRWVRVLELGVALRVLRAGQVA